MQDCFDAIDKAVTDRIDDLVELTQDLIKIPTINPPGDAYTPCCAFLANRLRKSGYQIELVRGHDTPGDSDRYPRDNIIARREGRSPGKTVHFNSHIDVVPVGMGWTKDPFGGEIEDGKIFGRGSCDMKGGLAASIVAAEALAAVYPDYPGAIEISGTVDEETGGFGGVAYLAQKGFFSKPRVDHVIIPEPLNKDRICLGHRGVWWAEIETFGSQAHGSMPFLGDCAVRHMGAVLNRFEEELYPLLDSKQTEMPIVPEGARRSTMNINSFHGGAEDFLRDDHEFTGMPAANVPDSCRMVIDRRFLIEEDLETVKGEVTQLLDSLKEDRPAFDYAIRDLWETVPTMTDKSAPVVEAVNSAIQTVLNKEAEFVISPGTYDQKHIARIGHLHDCIAYGPGILDLAHRPDEYVIIDDMVESAKVMALALHQLLEV
ncbi:MAG: acetylornithine deacetylase/succinyl-diaminopimelate desuccinylase family protein [Pseudomonadota bacterium]